ncbi:hypothetical protein [Clostridium sp. C2-6-12]|uniref:hypothetical protein n=1 Tax=Clostridium sp. C2-6-12 TaxID=2698832 RepID=UPI001367ABE7|nr:hypothetical protein [Clostridium sp. C2-6-12]
MSEVICKEMNEKPIEIEFSGELIKRVIILNPSKQQAAFERFFNSFPQFIGRETND